jgi:hypothetical protein
MTECKWVGDTDDKNEMYYLADLPENVTNIKVGEGVQSILDYLFKHNAKAVIIRIFPNEHQLFCKPFTWIDVNKQSRIEKEGWTEVNTKLKQENEKNCEEHFAFMIAETLVDIWNKFMVTEFVAKIDEQDPYSLMIGWDKYMTDKQQNQYWKSNTSDGYNPNALFWTREWLRDEHKRKATQGGKR